MREIKDKLKCEDCWYYELGNHKMTNKQGQPMAFCRVKNMKIPKNKEVVRCHDYEPAAEALDILNQSVYDDVTDYLNSL